MGGGLGVGFTRQFRFVDGSRSNNHALEIFANRAVVVGDGHNQGCHAGDVTIRDRVVKQRCRGRRHGPSTQNMVHPIQRCDNLPVTRCL